MVATGTRSEEELQHELKKADIMFRENPVSLVLYDLDLNITDCNPAFANVSGYSRDRLLAMKIKDFSVISIEGEGSAEAKRSRKKVSGKMTVDFPSGRKIISTYTLPLPDEKGETIGFMGVYTDITETELKTREILAFKQKTDALIEENPSAILIENERMDIVATNKTFCRLTGYTKDQILRMNVRDFKVINRDGGSGRDALRDGRMTTGSMTIDSPAGVRIFKVDYIPILNADGKASEVYAILTDLTKERMVQEYMEHEINEMSTRYEKIANGDLTIRYELTKPNEYTREVYDQITKLHLSVRAILNNLKTNINVVNKGMEELVATSGTATGNLEEIAGNSKEAAVQLGRVSKNTDKVSDNVGQVLKAMEDMSAAIEEVTSNMEAASALAKETNDLSRKGEEKAGKAGESMGRITASSQNVQTIVNDISEQMNEIIKIVGLIRDLANQTNLLALNAAIEAARAGDAGRGFAVVAAEVKSLAQESRNSAESIEEMIAGLRTKSLQATTAMDESVKAVKAGTEVIGETLTSFREIVTAVGKISRTSEEVASAAGEQAATVEEITASVHEVAQLMSETSKEAADVLRGAQQVSANVGDISRMVESVNHVATESLAANKKFKVA